ncbi:MAG: MarR family transcriptional regulator [Gammaproteobacteria bacterium]|nr:MarR family transcriptional regulator [Gammaproteobacteria bacterium]
MEKFCERYGDKIQGVLSVYDRVIIQGTLPGACHAKGMTSLLYADKRRIFDYPAYAKWLRDQVRKNVHEIARTNNLEIEHINKRNVRKDALVQKVLRQRGEAPGLVHILSAMESCSSYKPWYNKRTHKAYLKPDTGQCLHYYIYFIDEELGLTYVRVPTWCPFRLQIYFNGHNWLAGVLRRGGIDYELLDNAFVKIANYQCAQGDADLFNAKMLHQRLDRFAETYCPVFKQFGVNYHWSVMQVEYATDVVFKRQSDLQPIYEQLTRTAIHTVKPQQIATFLGKKLDPRFEGEMGNRFHTRIEGTCIKHHMGKVSIKMYDKYHLVLRIETTVNDLSFFKHYREVEHRDGTSELKWAPMKKGIYSLSCLQGIVRAANHRYLDFLASLDDPSIGIHKLEKITRKVVRKGRTLKGFHFLVQEDQSIFQALLAGEFNIAGFRSSMLRRKLSGKSSSQISRILKRLRVHGLIKKVGKTYKYYLTSFGREVIAMALKLKEMVVIPQLAAGG